MSTTQAMKDTTPPLEQGTRDEIDKILDEVEQLRKELSVSEKPGHLPSETGANDFDSGVSMEETLATLPEAKPENSDAIEFEAILKEAKGSAEKFTKYPQAVENLVPFAAAAPATSPEGTLSMTLSGAMTLKLNYECDGQSVTIGFSDGCLKISLVDGAEFKVPLGNRAASARKKTA